MEEKNFDALDSYLPCPDKPALLYLKSGGFGGLNYGNRLGFSKPASLRLGGQKGQNPQEPTHSQSYLYSLWFTCSHN
jgi:hypothetical protein